LDLGSDRLAGDIALMRRLTALAIALTAALSLVLAAPPRASACTSCPGSFQEFVHYNDRIVLARYDGRVDGRFVYHVLDVLKGRSPATLRFKYDPADGLHPPIGSRWLFSTDVPPDGLIRANAVFRVSPNGAVTQTDDIGEGRVEAPDTLAGWYRAIARLPDTSSATSAEQAESAAGPRQSPAVPVTLIAVAVLGAAATLRRLASNRVVMDPVEVERTGAAASATPC
jgi:hypothetical protein